MKDKLLGIVIIAAGNSSRLGTEKQLVKFRGQTLLKNSIDLALNFSTYAVCILGHQADRVKLNVRNNNHNNTKYSNNSDIDFVTNHNWQQGMGSSIAIGCEHFCNQERKFDAVMVMLCDQYLLQPEDLQQLLHGWQRYPNKIIASEYFEKKTNKLVIGAPAIFPQQYFDSLRELKEKGAKKIIEQNEASRVAIPIKNAATDLDTINDMKILLEKDND